MKHVVLFIIALLAVGCGSTSGVNLPVSPAQAQTTTNSATRRTLLATFDDGRQVGINIRQSASGLATGRAVAKDSSGLIVYQVNGDVVEGHFSLLLYPAENFGDHKLIIVHGHLDEDGTWRDLDGTNSGTVALTESVVNGQVALGPPLNGTFTANGTYNPGGPSDPPESISFRLNMQGGLDDDELKYTTFGTFSDVAEFEIGNLRGDVYLNGTAVIQLFIPNHDNDDECTSVWRAILAYELPENVPGSSATLDPNTSMVCTPQTHRNTPLNGTITFDG